MRHHAAERADVAEPAAGAGATGRCQAEPGLVTATNRRLVEDRVPRRSGDARVARDDLPVVELTSGWRSLIMSVPQSSGRLVETSIRYRKG